MSASIHRSLIITGLGYLIFGSLLIALFFFLDFGDVDKDVKYSQDFAQYWLALPALFLGAMILIGGEQASNISKITRICLSIYCFITSIISIVIETPDWMRYLSDNRSPDDTCKLTIIDVPGLKQEITSLSSFTCKRRSSYAWSVGFIIISAVLLINFSIFSILIHVWLSIKEEMVYRLPDFSHYSVSKSNEEPIVEKNEMRKGKTNNGFQDN